MVMTRNMLEQLVRNHMRSRFPGVFELLELACHRITYQRCIDLLIDYPEKLKTLLERIYGGTSTARLIIEVYVSAILLKVGKSELTHELVELFLSDPKEFANKLKELLQ